MGINGIHENGKFVEDDFYSQGDYDLAQMFGDRLEKNRKEFEELNAEVEAMDDDDGLLDDDPTLDGDLDRAMREIENEGVNEPEDSSDKSRN